MRLRSAFRSPSVCLGIACAGLLARPGLSAEEAEWPEWRGPGRGGTAAGASLPAGLRPNLELVWRKEVGEGYSGPVVSGGKLVVFSREGEEEVVRGLDAADGRELWKDSYAAPYKPASVAARHGKGPFATPTIARGKVFTVGTSGILSAYDLESGKRLWRHDFRDQFRRTHPSWGASNSPLVEGSLVVVGIGAKEEGGLAAFDAETGKLVWLADADGSAYSSPIAADLAGRRQIVALMEHGLLAVEPEGGKLLWKVPFEVQYEQNIFTPIARGDSVILGGWQQPLRAYRVFRKDGGFAVEELWKSEREAFFMNTPVLAGDHLYGLADRGGGTLVCVSAEDGRTRWSSEGKLGEYASIASAGERILVLTAKGALILLARNPERREELGRASLGEGAWWAHLALAGGRIYARSKTALTAFRLPPD
ncbi:MAG: PQQ-binding-like beta-propeller repeat protein [Planctomycetota bacterium]